ncbi:MAG TPA: flagellar biosynthetic protein FliR, partial [Isosphaeraceae bacterium]|nr:flagellar biosynthetic protein FliR [Isosphaeraceae bacterium]
MGWGIPAEDWSWVIGQAGAWGLVLARVLGLCLTAPVLAVPELDWRFRLALAAALGAVLAPVVGSSVEPPATWSNAAWAGLSELLAGGLIGWSAALVVAGARAAGDLVATQAGLATATLIDPESGEVVNPLGRLYGLIALAVFLALDGPLL